MRYILHNLQFQKWFYLLDIPGPATGRRAKLFRDARFTAGRLITNGQEEHRPGQESQRFPESAFPEVGGIGDPSAEQKFISTVQRAGNENLTGSEGDVIIVVSEGQVLKIPGHALPPGHSEDWPNWTVPIGWAVNSHDSSGLCGEPAQCLNTCVPDLMPAQLQSYLGMFGTVWTSPSVHA
ncbi:unnamed protein product [Symbiodinium sp. CCMP2592]|nr:unnamed protein product [Symbiodinium sp. CCMP2592]